MRTHRAATALGPGRAVFTPSIASEILQLHPRTLMIYEEDHLIKPKRTPTSAGSASWSPCRTRRAPV